MTDTRAWITDLEGIYRPAVSVNFGELKDAQMVKMIFSTTLSGTLINPDFPLLDGSSEVVRTGKQLRAGHNRFFVFVERLGQGKLRLHEVSVANIHGHFGFVKNEIEIQFFMSSNGLVCFLQNQDELVAALAIMVNSDTFIPDVSEHTEPAFVPGQVKWFDPRTLVGVIASDEGDLHFHLNNVENFSAWRRLLPGTAVSYRFTVKSTHPQSSLREARGVSLPIIPIQ